MGDFRRFGTKCQRSFRVSHVCEIVKLLLPHTIAIVVMDIFTFHQQMVINTTFSSQSNSRMVVSGLLRSKYQRTFDSVRLITVYEVKMFKL